MKFLTIFVLVVYICTINAKTVLDSCKCWTNYKAGLVGNKIQCISELTPETMPCNIPEAPKCVCKTAAVDAIMTDKYGKWCLGKTTKWPCENKEEWQQYSQDCKSEIYCIPYNHNQAENI